MTGTEVRSELRGRPLEIDILFQLDDVPASDVVHGEDAISAWYLATKQSLEPGTPARANNVVSTDGDTSSPEQDTSSPYKDRVVNVSPLRMELRSAAAQKLSILKI